MPGPSMQIRPHPLSRAEQSRDHRRFGKTPKDLDQEEDGVRNNFAPKRSEAKTSIYTSLFLINKEYRVSIRKRLKRSQKPRIESSPRTPTCPFSGKGKPINPNPNPNPSKNQPVNNKKQRSRAYLVGIKPFVVVVLGTTTTHQKSTTPPAHPAFP
jgi:hypothetical protein